MPPSNSEVLWLGTSSVSLVLEASEATLDLLGSQPHGACFWRSLAWFWVPGIELEGYQPRVWTAPGSILISIFSAWHRLISFRDVPFLGKNISKDACLTDELRRHSNQAFSFRDLGLLLTGHWVRRMSPYSKCSWHPLLPDASPLGMVLPLVSFESDSLETNSFYDSRYWAEGVSKVSAITLLGCHLNIYPKRWPLFSPNPKLSSRSV